MLELLIGCVRQIECCVLIYADGVRHKFWYTKIMYFIVVDGESGLRY